MKGAVGDHATRVPLVTLYTRTGCHLCEEAERVLVAERAVTPLELVTVDVDSDPELQRRYGVRVPVVAVDGEELFELEVPQDLLRARLRARHQGFPRRDASV